MMYRLTLAEKEFADMLLKICGLQLNAPLSVWEGVYYVSINMRHSDIQTFYNADIRTYLEKRKFHLRFETGVKGECNLYLGPPWGSRLYYFMKERWGGRDRVTPLMVYTALYTFYNGREPSERI